MNYLPPTPRPIPPMLRRSWWFVQLLVLGSGASAALLLTAAIRTWGSDDTPAVAFCFTGACVVFCVLGVHYRSERRLWIHGQEAVASVETIPRGMRFFAGSESIFVDRVPYLCEGAQEPVVLFDPRKPRQVRAVQLGMLPADTINALNRVHRPLLPARPRSENPAWDFRHRVVWPWLVATGCLWALVFLVWSACGTRDSDKIAILGFSLPFLLAAAWSALLGVRARAQHRGLWRDGVEARAVVLSESDSFVRFVVTMGGVVAPGTRNYATAFPLHANPRQIVVLIDPIDPERVEPVLTAELPD